MTRSCRFVAVLALLAATARASSAVAGAKVATGGQVLNPEVVKFLQNDIENLVQLAVQRTISSLPPATPQSISFDYDPDTDSFVRSARVPTSIFLTPDPTPKGRFALRATASYFELRDVAKTATYRAGVAAPSPSTFVQFGASAGASASVFTLALSYGLIENLEVDVLIPVSAVQAHASAIVSSCRSLPDPEHCVGVIGPNVFLTTGEAGETDLHEALQPGGNAYLASTSFRELGVPSLDGSTQVGLGRVALSGKSRVLDKGRARLALSSTFELPSPNSHELAGVDSAAWTPKLISAITLAEFLKLRVDVGYSLDFEANDRRYFGWDSGLTLAWPTVSLDAGVAGQVYNQPHPLIPSQFPVTVGERAVLFKSTDPVPDLPTTLVDLRFGVKVPLASGVWLAGIATVPVVGVEFRPQAIGTLSLEAAL